MEKSMNSENKKNRETSGLNLSADAREVLALYLNPASGLGGERQLAQVLLSLRTETGNASLSFLTDELEGTDLLNEYGTGLSISGEALLAHLLSRVGTEIPEKWAMRLTQTVPSWEKLEMRFH